jgi:hypothetical protein
VHEVTLEDLVGDAEAAHAFQTSSVGTANPGDEVWVSTMRRH